MFQLWSAGNVRIQKLDLTIPAIDAVELVDALKGDIRVSPVQTYHLSPFPFPPLRL